MSRPRPQDCAVVLIDLQVGSLRATSTRDNREVAAAAGALADLARLHRMPLVVTTGRRPGPDAVLVPEVAERTGGYEPIARSVVDAFDDPLFAGAVRSTERPTLLLGGVALDIGVTNVAMSGRALGYEVYVVAEAVATTDAVAHDTALSRLSGAGAHWIGFAALALGLMGDFSAATATQTQRLVASVAPAHAGAHPAGSETPAR